MVWIEVFIQIECPFGRILKNNSDHILFEKCLLEHLPGSYIYIFSSYRGQGLSQITIIIEPMTLWRVPLFLAVVLILSACSTAIQEKPECLTEPLPSPPKNEMTQPPLEVIGTSPSSQLESGLFQVNPIDEMEMVFVPSGGFEMGAPAELGLEICEKFSIDCSLEDYMDETPVHWVEIRSFWMYRTEVTNDHYRLCVEDGGCPMPAFTEFFQNELFSDHPVVYVDWYSAEAYCTWAGGRLPSEAEWEKASRGQVGRIFPWGDQPECGLGNVKGCTQGLSAAVGSFPDGSSPYGALDMAGNAAEWVADWYSADYYEDSPLVDPTGPEAGELRVARGGSWKNPFTGVRATNRTANFPDVYSTGVSFRCVVDISD